MSIAFLMGVGGNVGITPSGKKTITNTAETDVTEYAAAQVVDANLSAENIKQGVSILGITGTFEGGGDFPCKALHLPSGIGATLVAEKYTPPAGFNNIHYATFGDRYSYQYYYLNDGERVDVGGGMGTATDFDAGKSWMDANAITFDGVSKLIVGYFDGDGARNGIYVRDTNYNLVFESGDIYSGEEDVTPYLQDGYYVQTYNRT